MFLFCIIVCAVCVLAVVLSFFMINRVDTTLHEYYNKQREETRENSLHIGALEKRMHYVEKKVFNPEPKTV
jgi:hypothetical protein